MVLTLFVIALHLGCSPVWSAGTTIVEDREAWLLKACFESVPFETEFFICQKDEHKRFRVFDKSSFFREVSFTLPCNGSVDIKHKELDRSDMYKPFNLIIENVKIEGQLIKLLFYRPYSGAVVSLTFEDKGTNNFYLVDFHVGSI